MNENQTPVIWTVIIAAVALLILGGIAVGSINNNLKLAVDGLNDINVPSATEIASLIVIPEMSEFPEYMITEEDYEDNLIEAEALRLALEEVSSSDSSFGASSVVCSVVSSSAILV